MKKAFLYLPLALLGLAQCHSSLESQPSPAAQLPAITQTGANTFGCLVNGKVWTPSGYNGYSNYSVAYDAGYAHGTLSVATYRYIGKGDNDYQTLALVSDSLKGPGIYPLTPMGHHEAIFIDNITHCEFHSRENHFLQGVMNITRFDMKAGILSGTFWFTVAKPGCDTIKVTQGRFDKRL